MATTLAVLWGFSQECDAGVSALSFSLLVNEARLALVLRAGAGAGAADDDANDFIEQVEFKINPDRVILDACSLIGEPFCRDASEQRFADATTGAEPGSDFIGGIELLRLN